MLTVGSIIGGAFSLIRERPGAVAVWGLVYLVAGVATTFAMRPFVEMQVATLEGKAPADMSAIWSGMGSFMLVQLALFLLLIVVYTAAMRAVLRPHEGGPAYLSFGMDELRMIGLSILMLVLFYVGMIVVVLVLGVMFAAMFAGGGGAGGVLLVMLVPLIVFVIAIWLYVRLSLAFPLTLLRRRIVIGEAWSLSRGRTGTLFLAYLVVFIILIVLATIVGSVTTGAYWAELMRAGGNPDAVMEAAQNQMRQLAEINLMTVVGWVLNGIVGGIAIALLAGSAATAVRELTGDELLAREFG